MLFRHVVLDAHIVFVFDALDEELVVFVGFLRLGGGQWDAVAAERGFAHAVDGVAADGADIEFGTQHIRRDVDIADSPAGDQLGDGHAENAGDGFKQRDIRIALSVFPFGYGLVRYKQLLGELCLRQALLGAKLPDNRSGHIFVHGFHLHRSIITEKWREDYLRKVERLPWEPLWKSLRYRMSTRFIRGIRSA